MIPHKLPDSRLQDEVNNREVSVSSALLHTQRSKDGNISIHVKYVPSYYPWGTDDRLFMQH